MTARPATGWADGLLALNLALQLFDGVATYHGFAVWGEGNPLIRESIAALGLGTALVLFKSLGCVLLLFIRFSPAGRITLVGMATCAVALCALSVVPWLDRFWAEWSV